MKSDTNAASPSLAARELAADLAAVAGDNLQRARQALSGAQSAVNEHAGEIGTVAGEYVQAHPWRAIGVAGAAGLLLGLFLARR